jgi:hypothetical protein
MDRHVPIQTSLGELHGRDCIFLDEIKFPDGPNVLVLEGEINGNLCETRTAREFIPHQLKFYGVMALKMLELDSWQWDGQTTSSFFEIQESSWIQILEGKVTSNHKHYSVLTYDNVFEVVCSRFEFQANIM